MLDRGEDRIDTPFGFSATHSNQPSHLQFNQLPSTTSKVSSIVVKLNKKKKKSKRIKSLSNILDDRQQLKALKKIH